MANINTAYKKCDLKKIRSKVTYALKIYILKKES